MMNIGPMEIVLVLGIALIVLGPKRLPDAGRSIGRSLREFKRSVGGEDELDQKALSSRGDEEPAPAKAGS